jgi:hypothetical protein
MYVCVWRDEMKRIRRGEAKVRGQPRRLATNFLFLSYVIVAVQVRS